MATEIKDNPTVFNLKAKLPGHTGRIYCLAVNNGLLACGAARGTSIWDLRTMMEIPVAIGGTSVIGQMTALLWLSCDSRESWLVYGTARGRLVFLQREDGNDGMTFVWKGMTLLNCKSEVTAIAYDEGSRRMAVATRKRGFYVFKVEEVEGRLRRESLYALEIPQQFAKELAFLPTRTGRELHAFGLYDGAILTLDANGNIVEDRPTPSYIGGLSVLEDMRLVAIDDPMFGVRVYRTEGWSQIQVMSVPRKRDSGRPRCVAFINSEWVATGSDHGKIYILDRKSGEIVDELRIHRTEWVQAVETATVGSSKLLIAAHSHDSEENGIFVFELKGQDVINPAPSQYQQSDPTAPEVAYFVAFVCIMLVIWQNYGGVIERLLSGSDVVEIS